MKKNIKIIIMLLVMLGSFSLPVMAQPSAGKIIDIFGKGITIIQLEGENSFAVGDKIELVYMAGRLPMVVGDYQITGVKNDVCIAKPRSQTIPPDVGMKVEIDLLEKTSPASPNDEFLSHSQVGSSQPPAQILSLSDYGKSLGLGSASYEPQKQAHRVRTPAAQTVRNTPSAADKAAFSDYKKQLERRQKNLSNSERINRRIMSFWVPAQYRIGISIIDNDQLLGQAIGSTPTGVRVLWFASDSPAKKVLQVADIISAANGVTIQNAEQFKEIVKNTTEQNMQLKIQRNYELLEKTVRLKKQK